MGVYTIAITPEAVDQTPMQVMIRAKIDADVSRIIEIAIRSAEPGGLSQGAFPQIDLHAIAQVLLSGAAVGQQEPAIAGGPETTPDGPGRPPLPLPDEEAVSVGSDRVTTRRRSLRRPAAGGGGPATTAPREGSGRAYRRMPDAEEVLAVYEKVGTVTGVAGHYGVPRHTAQGWMGRIRKASVSA